MPVVWCDEWVQLERNVLSDITLRYGDCIEVMSGMDKNSIDAIVCDPPYGLEFMGKDWDKIGGGGSGRTVGVEHAPTLEARNDSPQHRSNVRQPSVLMRCERCRGNSSGVWNRCKCDTPDFRSRSDVGRAMQDWHEAWATEALRVLKPGGHLLAFGGTRTYHRLTCAIEDAGFEIRDCLAWMYGSGFPKSLDVSKAIDKAAGAEREETGREPRKGRQSGILGKEVDIEVVRSLPATPEAAQWSGWGTALKPAFEPIVLARKPLIGTVAKNVLAHGTGGLNVDGCRIEGTQPHHYEAGRPSGENSFVGRGNVGTPAPFAGRWPANVLLDEQAAEMLDEQSGVLHSQSPETRQSRSAVTGVTGMGTGRSVEYGDSGGASRFFYCAKASRKERGPDNTHPTVKPLALMKYLITLVTPPDGTILDPFLGSGTTLVAAKSLGFSAIGIDNNLDYIKIANTRLANQP